MTDLPIRKDPRVEFIAHPTSKRRKKMEVRFSPQQLCYLCWQQGCVALALPITEATGRVKEDRGDLQSRREVTFLEGKVTLSLWQECLQDSSEELPLCQCCLEDLAGGEMVQRGDYFDSETIFLDHNGRLHFRRSVRFGGYEEGGRMVEISFPLDIEKILEAFPEE